jgi:hypothetical protein
MKRLMLDLREVAGGDSGEGHAQEYWAKTFNDAEKTPWVIHKALVHGAEEWTRPAGRPTGCQPAWQDHKITDSYRVEMQRGTCARWMRASLKINT